MRSPRRFPLAQLVLLVLLLLAAGWVLHLRRGHPAPAGPIAVGPGPDFADPTRICFRLDRDSVVVERVEDGYAIVHPLRDRADPLFIAEVVRRARELTAERVLEPAAGDPYRLEGPGPALGLTAREGRSWSLRLGDEAPAGSLVYARTSAAPAAPLLLDRFTVRKYFLPELTVVRDPSPTALRPGPVDSIIVVVPGRELHVVRAGQDVWLVRKPAGQRADPLALSGVIRLLRDPTILGYPPPEMPPAAMGLAPPRAVWVLCQGSRRDSVSVGHATLDQRGVYIRPAHRTAPAIVPVEKYRLMVDGWPGLVDRRLLRLPADSVTVVEFLGQPFRYQRSADGWQRDPGGKPVPRLPAFQQEIANLGSLRWVRYPMPEEPPPLSARRLALRLATPSAVETLFLAESRDSLGWARASSAPRWGVVPASSWNVWSYRASHDSARD